MCKEKSSLFLLFQTGMCLDFPFQLSYSVQVNLFHSQYSLQSITFKDQVKETAYFSVFTGMNWPKHHRFLLVPHYFMVCLLIVQQLHITMKKYAIITLFRHSIHEGYTGNQITKLLGMMSEFTSKRPII